jgi:hypothetical protein
MSRQRISGLVLVSLALVACGCDETLDSPLVPSADFMGPASVVDLEVGAVGQTSVALTWTAPRAHTEDGRVARYEILYATGDPDSIDWNAAPRIAGPAQPHSPGSTERFTVNGLATLQSFQLAVRSADSQGRRSALSNRVSATTDWHPQSQAELIDKLRAAYAGQNRTAFETLFSTEADSAEYFFFLNEPAGANWDLTEELRIHRRMFEPQHPVPGESPVPQDLWLLNIEIQLVPQKQWTERPDLYRSPGNPTGLDPARWRVTEAMYNAYVFWHTQGQTDYQVNSRQNFVVVEDRRRSPGEARKFLLYRWEELDSYLQHDVLVEPSRWGRVKAIYK